MNISDYKDEELIAELHERFRKPTIEEMIEESFSRIDQIMDKACDDLDDLALEYTPRELFKRSAAQGRLRSGDAAGALQRQAIEMAGRSLNSVGAAFGALGLGGLGLF